MIEERKLVTVLFADIVGSTAATASEDPEVVRTTLGRVFAEMRGLLTGHGGTVEKFIGDAVMCVFGIPQAHDDDAERAVRAALALRSRIADLAAMLAFPVDLRIGVNTGRVVTGAEGAETLVTGVPGIAAARLQQAAAPGQILVGAVTHGLTKDAVRYGPARTVEAKGLGPLEAHPAEALLDALPVQHRGLAGMRAPLIGRDAELRVLHEAWRRTVEERSPFLVTLYGQPGVGKSRLVSELVEVIGSEHVRGGRCLTYGSGITYWPLREIVRTDAAVAGDDAPDVASAKIRAAVLAAFGDTSDDAEAVAGRLAIIAGLASADETLRGVTGDDLAKELRWAVRRYLELRALARPLALVIDDLHWAEAELLDLVEHLADRARAPLFIVCLARPDLRERRPTWGGGLTNASAIQLEPLDEAETRRLIAALLPIEDLAEDLRAEVVRRAEGNPLYVEELLRMLLETGQIERRDGRYVATGDIRDLAIPPTLEGLLAARLDQLDPEAKRAVRVASVVGQVFYPGALAALGIPEGEIDAALLRAARRDLVLELDERGPDGRPSWSFKHLLIRDAAYESLPKAERWRLHDAMGRWLETVPGAGDVAGIVAHHAERAFWIARELREERSARLGARALDLTLAEARRVWSFESSPQAKRGRYAAVLDLVAAVGAPSEVAVEARGRLALASRDLERGGNGGPQEVQEADEAIAAALAEARDGGPSEVLVELLSAVAWNAGGRGPAPGLQALYAEATAAARRLGDPALVALTMLHETWPARWEGRLSESLARCEAARQYIVSFVQGGTASLGGSQGSPLGVALSRLSVIAFTAGEFEAAARYLDDLANALPSLAPTAWNRKVMPLRVAAFRSRLAGDIEGWVTNAARWVEAELEIGAPPTRDILAEALHRAGREAEALAEIETLFSHERIDTSWAGEDRQLFARILLGLRGLDRARDEAERAYREIRDPDPFSRSSTSLTLGLVREADGDLGEAERLLRQAVDCGGEYRTVSNDARVELARFLMRHGRAAEARPLLESARDFYVLPYAEGWHDRIEALIRECEAIVPS